MKYLPKIVMKKLCSKISNFKQLCLKITKRDISVWKTFYQTAEVTYKTFIFLAASTQAYRASNNILKCNKIVLMIEMQLKY